MEKHNDRILLSLRCCSVSPSIKTARVLVTLLHMTIFLAASVSFWGNKAAEHWHSGHMNHGSKDNKSEYLDISQLLGLSDYQCKVVRAVHEYLAHVLFLSSLLLGCYWTVFGLCVSCKFGSPCSMWSLVACLPLTLTLVIWQVLVAIFTLHAMVLLSDRPWLHQTQAPHPLLLHAGKKVDDFFSSWGPWIVSSYLGSALVMTTTTVLPFLMSRLPWERFDCEGSVGGRMLEEMAVAYNGGRLVRDPWIVTKLGPHPRLAARDTLAGGVTLYTVGSADMERDHTGIQVDSEVVVSKYRSRIERWF